MISKQYSFSLNNSWKEKVSLEKERSSYKRKEKTRANSRDEKISNDNGGGSGPHKFHKSQFEIIWLVGSSLYYHSKSVCEAIEIKSEFFPKTILPLFQVLSYLIACPSRRFRKTENIMFHYLWKVSSVLWNSRPIAAPAGNTFNLFSGLLHVPCHWRSRWLQRFRIQFGLRSPSKLRCGCFRLWNSICDLIATGRETITFIEPVNLWSHPVSCNGPFAHAFVLCFVSLFCFCSLGKQFSRGFLGIHRKLNIIKKKLLSLVFSFK